MSKMGEKVAYLKGLAEGMGVNAQTEQGKLMLAMIDTLEAFGYYLALDVVYLDGTGSRGYVALYDESVALSDVGNTRGDVASSEDHGLLERTADTTKLEALAKVVADACALVDEAEGHILLVVTVDGDEHPLLGSLTFATALVIDEGTDAEVLKVVDTLELGDNGHVVGVLVRIVVPEAGIAVELAGTGLGCGEILGLEFAGIAPLEAGVFSL